MTRETRRCVLKIRGGMERTIQGLKEKWQFLLCLGVLDGKHTYIKPLANSGSVCQQNYQSGLSVLMLAAVDAHYICCLFVLASQWGEATPCTAAASHWCMNVLVNG